MSEITATFLDIVGPMRREFAIDPVTGDLVDRRPGLLAMLLRGLTVLGCAHGHALMTPAASLVDEPIHPADARPQEK